MGALLMIFDSVINQGEGMVVRHYGKRHGSGGMLFNAIICLFSILFFVITDRQGLYFSGTLVLYGLVSSLFFAIGFYAMYMALQLGSFIATKLISSFSGVISIVYGIFFLHEESNVITWLAIGMVFLSVFLMRYKKSEPDERKKLSAGWLFWTLTSAVSNGLIAVISREQQLYFSHAYDNEFMIVSFGGAFAMLTVLGIIKERDTLKSTAKNGVLYGAVAGLLNGGKNWVNLLLYLYVPISVATPMKTGLGLLLSFLISLLIYKEKFSKRQLISVGIGAVALILFKVA